MRNVLPNGAEVLIFNYISEWGPNQDEEQFIRGVIKSSKRSDDLSSHESTWHEQIYTVLGEDGKEYCGLYGRGIIGNAFFRTIEDHINYLMSKISQNDQKMKNLENENNTYVQKINDLEKLQLESIMEKISSERIESLIENYSRLGSLEVAYVYLKSEKYICLVLAYSDWNDTLEMIANLGVYRHNFDEENNINLKIYAIPAASVIDDFSTSNAKIIYDKNEILTNYQDKALNKTLKTNS